MVPGVHAPIFLIAFRVRPSVIFELNGFRSLKKQSVYEENAVSALNARPSSWRLKYDKDIDDPEYV